MTVILSGSEAEAILLGELGEAEKVVVEAVSKFNKIGRGGGDVKRRLTIGEVRDLQQCSNTWVEI